jgi:hypothetical protein
MIAIINRRDGTWSCSRCGVHLLEFPMVPFHQFACPICEEVVARPDSDLVAQVVERRPRTKLTLIRGGKP